MELIGLVRKIGVGNAIAVCCLMWLKWSLAVVTSPFSSMSYGKQLRSPWTTFELP
jgi:hypothetical protein